MMNGSGLIILPMVLKTGMVKELKKLVVTGFVVRPHLNFSPSLTVIDRKSNKFLSHRLHSCLLPPINLNL